MKKTIAVIILVLQASCAHAGLWDNVCDYVSGWFTGSNVSHTDTLPDNIAGNWDKLTNTLDDALTLRDKQESLPNSAWFGEDKVSNAAKINALLDKALVILSDGNSDNARSQAVKLKARLTDLRSQLDTLRNKRINAPDKTYIFWHDTKSKIDAKISQIQQEISLVENNISTVNAKVVDELSQLGISLTEEQADILINSVTGEDIIHNTVIFENVKAVTATLEQLSRQDSNNHEIIRRYAGMYLVLNDILIHTQEQLVRTMDSDYRPKLADILKEAEALRKDALSRSNNRKYSSSQRKSFALNAKSNAATIQAAKLYGKLLDAQKLSLMNSIKSLRLNRDLAENTYNTVKSSGQLRGLIHSGLDTIDAVIKLSMPELNIFEGNTFRAEFDEINRRLKQ